MKFRLEKLKTFIANDDNINYTVAMSLLDDAFEELTDDVNTYKTVANVTFDPVAGAVTIGTTIAMATSTADADIYYTDDGSTPDNTDTEYTEEYTITEAVTLKAIGYKNYQNASTAQSAAYTIALAATPVADPVAGEVAAESTVTLTCATAGATIYYTTDGSDPDDTDTEYTTAITITEAVTIKAIAYADTYAASEILSAAYTIAE